MNPRVAAGLAPLLSLQLRVIETTDLEQRLKQMQTRIKMSPTVIRIVTATRP
jgi:hypothetical protein